MIDKIKTKIESIVLTINFYRFNPCSIPIVNKQLCKFGRHDFELSKVIDNQYAELVCFYCGQKKNSTAIEKS